VFELLVDNPYQTPPREYDKQAQRNGEKKDTYPTPLFKRGGVTIIGNNFFIKIAGTAAIKGREKQYVGDSIKQTEETIKIMELLLKESEKELGKRGFIVKLQLSDLVQSRVYIKDAADYKNVAQACYEKIKRTNFVLADVCYDELGVEIEGIVVAELIKRSDHVEKKGRHFRQLPLAAAALSTAQ